MKSEGEKLLIRVKKALEAGELPGDDDRATFCKAVAMMAREDSREDAQNMLLHNLGFNRKGGRPAHGGLHEMQKVAIVAYYESQLQKRLRQPNRFKAHRGKAKLRADTVAKYEISEAMLKQYRAKYGAFIRSRMNDEGKMILKGQELSQLFAGELKR